MDGRISISWWNFHLRDWLHNKCKLNCMTTLSSSDWYLFEKRKLRFDRPFNQVPGSLDCSHKALISPATLTELIFRFSGFAFRHLQWRLWLERLFAVCRHGFYGELWEQSTELVFFFVALIIQMIHNEFTLHPNSFANFWAFQLVNHSDKHPR